MKHYEGGTNLGWDLGVNWIEWKAERVIFNSLTKAELCIKYLKDWQAAGTFTLKTEVDTVPRFVDWDGENTTHTVLMKTGIQGFEPLSITQFGDTWVLGQIDFVEVGTRS